ncbi:Nucleotidyl transferase AbiEii toxin, Type IV TA system [Mucilaginibacter pineti]|uniref:Nucleotidyl transferase AbiEii toxin, Type IV TA system n=1 Tax=Mucilaginibacter pineti TaxID=1391627 RepID=A0A1G6Z954_9SPHI|nr:nucleotidyl transferase AbiEii/AbiGii toxin family protein [Mucilaginibacter pineti]SDD99178.1 Nucleotidyl transferase AbiEii toxin, Type IV TA system [Mucilaginibacter pineti]
MLHWETVSEDLKQTLLILMEADVLKDYRLVGGTALSLYLGHRMSVDIDLFTDAANYGKIDYNEIEEFLIDTFPYVSGDFGGVPVFGKGYVIGKDKDNAVKVDIYYASESFTQEAVESDGIRLATIDDIVAMKTDVISRGGRKKDFWDLHELLDSYTIDKMIALHAATYEWTHDENGIVNNFTDFAQVDEDFDPICLKGKEWAFIKDDFEEALKKLENGTDPKSPSAKT